MSEHARIIKRLDLSEIVFSSYDKMCDKLEDKKQEWCVYVLDRGDIELLKENDLYLMDRQFAKQVDLMEKKLQ
jgi:hypothetical protein